jgi:hypothetical protein
MGKDAKGVTDMFNRRMIPMFAIAALLVASSATAQFWGNRWGGGELPSAGACFYQNANYRGPYFCLQSGQSLDAVPQRADDRVSSIRILGQTEVVVFQNTGFGGQSMRFDADVPNLQSQGFNDQVSSIQTRNLTASTAPTEYWGGSLPQNGVCFYQDPYFQGQSLCLESGQELTTLPWGTDDRISSIRILGNAEVMVFQDSRFGGVARRFTSSVEDLQTLSFNDQISSVQTRSAYASNQGGAWSQTPGGYWDQTSAPGVLPRDGACFYEDPYYGGRYFCVEAGQTADVIPAGANDRISSVRILGNAEVSVYENASLSGDSRRLAYSVQDLQTEGFADRLSSVQVRSTIGGGYSGEGYGYNDADAIVRRAYRDILGREPDAEGLRIYRSHIIDRGWTEQQVREALRESAEYKQKNVMTRAKAQEIVRQAYLVVLKREPDPKSAGYVDRVLRDNWTQADVERELRRSPEYLNR